MQEKNTHNMIVPEGSAAEQSSEKEPYHPPTLTNYGSLVELVQSKLHFGSDASPTPD